MDKSEYYGKPENEYRADFGEVQNTKSMQKYTENSLKYIAV